MPFTSTAPAVVLFVLCLWTTALSQAPAAAPADAPKPFVLGVVEEFRSAALKENRILNIYLPPGYKESDDTRYPVIYLLDGSADEDFIHIVGIVQYNNFSWVNRVPKSIVVGIANINRRRDFTFPTRIESDRQKLGLTGGSERFISFVEKELQPLYRQAVQNNGFTDAYRPVARRPGGDRDPFQETRTFRQICNHQPQPLVGQRFPAGCKTAGNTTP